MIDKYRRRGLVEIPYEWLLKLRNYIEESEDKLKQRLRVHSICIQSSDYQVVLYSPDEVDDLKYLLGLTDMPA